MIVSQPINSPVSSKMQVAPSVTSRSKARPTAGLADIPLVPSEPPQIVPTTSSSIRNGARGVPAAAARTRSTAARPRSIVAAVPPSCWITSSSTGLPLAATASASPSRSKLSQPSETSTIPPTFGCVAIARITFAA
jgi:hypothetical protein